MMSSQLNPFAVAQHQLDEAAAILGLPPALKAYLSMPVLELHFTVPLQLDDGSYQVYEGFRVQYNDARGPARGGIRFHPNESIDSVRASAAWLSWKMSVIDLPLSGGTGGVMCDPRALSQAELERLSRGYIRRVAHFIGPARDVPAPDLHTSPHIIAWMMDEYEVITGRHLPGSPAGRPLNSPGAPSLVEATALGGICAVREAARVLDIELDGATAAIYGYGVAGPSVQQWGADLLGLRTVAVSDAKGGIYNPHGLDLQAVRAWKSETGSVVNFPGADSVTNAGLLELPVTVIFLTALEGVLSGLNAARITARIIGELANGATTPEADRILQERDIYLIPDLLCNAGSVIMDYLEQVQDACNLRWSQDEAHAHLDAKMTEAFHAVHETAQAYHVHTRLGAYLLAIKRIAEAVAVRGWVR